MIHFRIAQYIEREQLFNLNDRVLVALSGGADSVALLRVLLALGYTCGAAHCNFHLRGEESDRDQHFVEELCARHKVPFHLIHFPTEEYAEAHKISIEMAARELRYEWFDRLCEEEKYKVVAVAHHQDDSVETVLLNLIRGTGIHGLTGIRPVNGKIVRPLLCVDRSEILDYLSRLNQHYVIDSTNLQDEYTRNKIRINILPLLQSVNPSVKESILRTASHLAEVETLFDKTIEEGKRRVLKENGIIIEALEKEPAPKSLLFEILRAYGFNSAQVEDIYRCRATQPGKVFYAADIRVVKDRGSFLLLPPEQHEGPVLIDKPTGELVFGNKRFRFSLCKREPEFKVFRDKNLACLDADKLTFPLMIRQWQTGDKFVPFGMTGKKNVSDYLTDNKKNFEEREETVVVCSQDKIVWLAGERPDNRFRIEDTTKNILLIELLPVKA